MKPELTTKKDRLKVRETSLERHRREDLEEGNTKQEEQRKLRERSL